MCRVKYPESPADVCEHRDMWHKDDHSSGTVIASTFPRPLGPLWTSAALVMNVAAQQEGNFRDFMKWVQTFTREPFGLSSSKTGAFLSHPFTCEIFKIKRNMARILNNIFKMSTDRYLITLRNWNMKKHVSLLHRLDHTRYISYMMQKAAKGLNLKLSPHHFLH